MTDTTTADQGGAGALSEEQLATQAFGAESQPVVEGDDVPAADPAPAETEQADESAPSGIDTFEQLVEALGAKPEDVLGLKYKLKIDGEEKEVTLADLVKVNQLEGHVTKKSMEVAEQRKAFETERQQWQNAYRERIAVADQVANRQLQQLQLTAQQLEASGLAQSDPSQYLMIKDQINTQWQATQAERQAIAQNYQQTQAQLTQVAQQQAVQAIRTQHPDLSDEASYGNALAGMRAYLKEMGVQDQGMQAIQVDPVVFSVVRDAMRYRDLQKARPQVQNKVRTAPTVGRPGSKGALTGLSARAQNVIERARHGDESSLAEWLANS